MADLSNARPSIISAIISLVVLLPLVAGRTWAEDLIVPDEYPDIRTAYAAATDGDTIIIKPGRYIGVGNRGLLVTGKTITIRGTDPGNQKIIQRTIIDCEGEGFAFRFIDGNTSELAGLTIMGGHVDSGAGGAIRIEDSSPTVRRCIVRENRAAGAGGAVFIASWSNNTPSNPKFIECEFKRNESSGDGGAFSIVDNSSPVFDGCTFDANVAGGRGGAVYLYGSSNMPTCTPEFTRCTFNDNVSQSDTRGGGAICAELNVAPVILDGQFSGNVATADGGAVYSMQSVIQVARSVFDRNRARHGGAISLQNVSDSNVTNSIIAKNNAAGYGGGVYVADGSTAMLRHVTMADNTADLAGGAACAYTSSTLTVSHSIAWRNQPDQLYGSRVDPTVRWSDVQNGFAGEGNIDADPMFIDAPRGDYRLDYVSPCFNAGDPAFQPDPDEKDIEGDARLIFGRVDMGADEKTRRNSHALVQLDPVPGAAGEMNTFAVTEARSGETVYFCYSMQEGSTRLPECGTQILNLRNPKVISKTVADGDGRASIEVMVPLAAQGRTVYLQAVELSSCSVSNSIAFLFD